MLEFVENKYKLNRVEATKMFMNICGSLKNDGKEMFIELANKLEIDSSILFSSKKIQCNVIERIKNE